MRDLITILLVLFLVAIVAEFRSREPGQRKQLLVMAGAWFFGASNWIREYGNAYAWIAAGLGVICCVVGIPATIRYRSERLATLRAAADVRSESSSLTEESNGQTT